MWKNSGRITGVFQMRTNQGIRRFTFFDPILKIAKIVHDGGSGPATTVSYTGNHEETKEVLSSAAAADDPLHSFVVIRRAQHSLDFIRPSRNEHEFSSCRFEAPQI